MKFPIVFLASFSLVFMLCSCSSFEVTKDLSQALGDVERGIVYHDRAYMEKRPMKVPDGMNVGKLGELRFNFGFERGNKAKPGEETLNANYLTDNEWNAFKREFENAVAGTKRFPIAQIHYGLADNELRKKTRNGLSNTKELDVSALKEATAIIHIIPMLSQSESLVKKQKTVVNTLKLVCNPLSAENNSPLDDFQPFSAEIRGTLYQKTDRMGNVVGGFRLYTTEEWEDYHIKLCRASIVQFFNKMYSMFPTGGAVTKIDEDGQAVLKAGRATGIQPNMEFVIFAMKKGDPDSKPTALYNATVETVGQKSNSVLSIWRKSDRKSAVKIIKLIEKDFEAARDEYDFYACSDGFAQWPDFIDRITKDK